MGELHIEVIHDRIKREYGLETYLGPLQVAYRETVLSSARATGKKENLGQFLFLFLSVEVLKVDVFNQRRQFLRDYFGGYWHFCFLMQNALFHSHL